MIHSRCTMPLLAHAALIALATSSAASAQSLDEQKKQLEIEQAELNKQKTMLDIIKGPAQSTAGNSQLTTIENSAEGLMLSRYVQERAARTIVSGLGPADGTTISVVFGDQPLSTADYLVVRRGAAALKSNLERAVALAHDFYDKPEASREPDDNLNVFAEMAGVGAVPLALTAVTTIASILRVNTNMTGVALAVPNEQFKAVMSQELRRYGWRVDPPRAIVTATDYVDGLFADMKPAKDDAAKYFQIYAAHLAKKGGKPAELSDAEVIVGKALESSLNEHAAFEKALFTPANGVLPATVIQEQKALAETATTRRMLYVQHHKAALTSITKQGTFTGIIGVPAYVAASYVVEYAMQGPDGGKYGTVRYDTPVMRVTSVRRFLAKEKLADQRAVEAGTAADKGAAAGAGAAPR